MQPPYLRRRQEDPADPGMIGELATAAKTRLEAETFL